MTEPSREHGHVTRRPPVHADDRDCGARPDRAAQVHQALIGYLASETRDLLAQPEPSTATKAGFVPNEPRARRRVIGQNAADPFSEPFE
jgi:hypothetical protein